MDQEIMDFLDERIFNPIENNPAVPESIRRKNRFTRDNISKLPRESMIKYFWSSIVSEGIAFSNEKRNANLGLPKFEDILEEFRVRFPSRIR
jgi:hypothetical protein